MNSLPPSLPPLPPSLTLLHEIEPHLKKQWKHCQGVPLLPNLSPLRDHLLQGLLLLPNDPLYRHNQGNQPILLQRWQNMKLQLEERVFLVQCWNMYQTVCQRSQYPLLESPIPCLIYRHQLLQESRMLMVRSLHCLTGNKGRRRRREE